jgi:hypothetical protein
MFAAAATPVSRESGREAMTALGAAALDHEPAALRTHAHQKAVSPSPAAVVGLERSLHCFRILAKM